MSLSPGTRIGSYEILAPLGRGGMGEVWRARDTKLRREVAIKALPAEFAADPERRARFEREAHMLAALNHPNVAAIYGLEEAGDAVYLILELVEGETLTEKLASGPLPAGEALAIAAQIAAGLEAAHEAGVIHRDLKPSNVKVRPDGSVKVLDLGLARAVDPAAAPHDLSQSPTVTSAGGTRSGVILGTAAYMSPEQARGRPLDKRTDIFSFGCVLFECLTGRVAFPGETVSDTLAAILTAEPAWSALPSATPARLAALLRRCLQKDRKQRLHDIADARIEIEETLAAGTSGRTLANAAAPQSRTRLVWALSGAVVGAAIAAVALRSARPGVPSVPSLHAALPIPAGIHIPIDAPSVALSPDGRTVVFRGRGEGQSVLYRRSLGGRSAEPIQGTEGGFAPFFSPDGQWLGFFLPEEMRKVPISGGSPVPLSRLPPITAGATWGADGKIVLTPLFNGGLSTVSESGGPPQHLTKLDAGRGEHGHLYPQLLPGGRGILFTLRLGRDFLDIANSSIAVLDTTTGKWKTVLEGASYARYGGGRLVFVRANSVFSAPFDASRFEVTGPAVPLPEQVAPVPELGVAQFDVAPDGTLAFVDGLALPAAMTAVLSLDRQGKETILPVPAGTYNSPRLSPDGRRLALTKWIGMGDTIVVYDRQRQILSTLTPEPGSFFSPTWSADGKRIAMTGFGPRNPELFVKNADGNGEVEALAPPTGDAAFPNAWSPDGKTLVYTMAYTADHSPTRKLLSTDIWLLSVADRSVRPWLETPFRETAPSFSPDGNWIAYVSNESGSEEIYVRPYPGPGTRIKISNDSGIEPSWTRGGRELVYRTGPRAERFLAVDVRMEGGSLTASLPHPLFLTHVPAPLSVGGREDVFREFDISRDGNELIALRSLPRSQPDRDLVVVTHWASSVSGSAK